MVSLSSQGPDPSPCIKTVINKNEVVRRDAVLSRFWDVEDKDYFASRSLDVFIKKIRTAIEDEPSVELRTIRGVGFKLIVE